MGTYITSPNFLAAFLGEQVGFKSGLALTREEIAEHTIDAAEICALLLSESDDVVRVKTDKIEDAFQQILFRLGVTKSRAYYHGPTVFSMKYQGGTAAEARAAEDVLKVLGAVHFDLGRKSLFDGFDEARYIETVRSQISAGAEVLARELVGLIRDSELASPWSWHTCRVEDWAAIYPLQGLFKSESLDVEIGNHLDRRFVNYLSANFDSIDKMNWRKFEGLVGEFFSENGMSVDLGPGRNDGNVDIRVWERAADRATPPMILVQCKRQAAAIEKVVVKALWADVVHEGAASGMIVTTSRLAPGAEAVRTERAYPVGTITRDGLKSWLQRLRTPGTGVYLGD